MAQITRELVLAQAREISGGQPTPERAEELARTLNLLIEALDEAAADITLEAEPAKMPRALDEAAGE